jgi:quercetin dioxygenase-like cupin family protein
MQVTRTRILLCGMGLMTALVVGPVHSQATPPSGVTASPLVRGTFTDDVSAKFTVSHNGRTIVSNAKDASQVVFQNLSFAPGGHTGWHSHPGPVVVTVKSGTLTYYEGSGPCVGREYPAGSAFLDPGKGHVHIARNEGPETVETSVVYFGVPEGESPRIDAPAPGNCDF